MTSYNRKYKRRHFAFVVGVGSMTVTWLLSSISSPLFDYFIFHGGFKQVWLTLNMLPYLAVIMLGDRSFLLPSTLVGYAAIFVQWSAIGFFASGLIFRDKAIRLNLQ